MISIGFRAAPTAVHYAVVAEEAGGTVVRAVSLLVVPAALRAPEQLAFIRTTLLDVISEYGAQSAGTRTTEPIARKPNVLRVNIEGVIQELIASGAVATHFAGPIATIAGLLGMPRADMKKYVEGTKTYPGTSKWNTYTEEQREALLAAMAAQHVPAPRFAPLMPANTEVPTA